METGYIKWSSAFVMKVDSDRYEQVNLLANKLKSQ